MRMQRSPTSQNHPNSALYHQANHAHADHRKRNPDNRSAMQNTPAQTQASRASHPADRAIRDNLSTPNPQGLRASHL